MIWIEKLDFFCSGCFTIVDKTCLLVGLQFRSVLDQDSDLLVADWSSMSFSLQTMFEPHPCALRAHTPTWYPTPTGLKYLSTTAKFITYGTQVSSICQEMVFGLINDITFAKSCCAGWEETNERPSVVRTERKWTWNWVRAQINTQCLPATSTLRLCMFYLV